LLLDRKTLSEASFSDVIDLRDDGVHEGDEIDYKRALIAWDSLPDTELERERNEFANDVCAFANARGGWIVYGVKCRSEGDTSIPEEIVGVPDHADLDAERLRLLALAKSRTRPSVEIEVDKLEGETPEGKRQVLVVHIPASWNPPHMSAVQYVFYQRQGPGKVRMDADQLRRMILGGQTWHEHLRGFLNERWTAVKENTAPEVPIPVGCVHREDGADTPQLDLARVVLHVTPSRSFDRDAFADVIPVARRQQVETLYLDRDAVRPYVPRSRPMLEGFYAYGPSGNGPVTSSYSLAFRNGVIESVDSQCFRTPPPRDGLHLFTQELQSKEVGDWTVRTRLLEVARGHSELVEALGHPLPHGVSVGFVNADGWTISGSGRTYGQFAQGDIRLPVLLFENRDEDLTRALDELFVFIWQAAGKDTAPPQ
jgi:hypothetical protein